MFISNSFDALSHFETDIDNVMELYKKISGKELNLDLPEDTTQQG